MQEQYNFPVKVRILDREYKHVLTWQQNGAKIGFEIVTVEPPVHVPDPTPSAWPIKRQARDISAMTVPQLKEQLRQRGLRVSGVKAALITRLSIT